MFIVNALKIIFFFILFMVILAFFKRLLRVDDRSGKGPRIRGSRRGGPDSRRPDVIELDKDDYRVE